MNYNIIKDLFPTYLQLNDSEMNADEIILHFESTRTEIECPVCGQKVSKITTYFKRTLQDLPLIDKKLILDIKLKKFCCENSSCSRKIISEQVAELALEKNRRTTRLDEKLIRFALTNTAEGTARLMLKSNINVSGDTLLRICKKWSMAHNKDDVIAIGVDDFALKKNIDMELFLST
ncbi:MAG: transposase [Halanaerobiales bacterium]|nr:transposase [Halanaerobiales bacterium]